jgi:hypothetical protein
MIAEPSLVLFCFLRSSPDLMPQQHMYKIDMGGIRQQRH